MFATSQSLLGPRTMSCQLAVRNQLTHSGSDQSRFVGQRRAPVHSWWNPRSSFTFRARGGFNDWPFGVIHSSMAPFKLFVSSPRAPEAPLRSYGILSFLRWMPGSEKQLTSSAIKPVSSSDPVKRRSSRPTTDCKRARNILCSRRSLNCWYEVRSENKLQWRDYSALKDSSGWSASSPNHKMPLFISVRMLQNTWTVRPKWRPWCTRGSVTLLWKSSLLANIHPVVEEQYGFFRGPSSSALQVDRTAELPGSCWEGSWSAAGM